MKDEAKTAKELAAELDVTVQTIYRRLKKINQLGEYTFKLDGVTRITAEGVALISQQERAQAPQTPPQVSTLQERSPAVDELIRAQQAHIETLTQQLESITRQLEMEKQTRLLEAETRRQEFNARTIADNLYSTDVKDVKPSIWQRIRNTFTKEN